MPYYYNIIALILWLFKFLHSYILFVGYKSKPKGKSIFDSLDDEIVCMTAKPKQKLDLN